MLKNILFLFPFATLLLSVSCKNSRHDNIYTTIEGSVWHTSMHITYNSDCNLKDSILAITGRVENSLSPFLADSKISLINRNEDMSTDMYIEQVFTESQRINSLSAGAFDPTVAPLVNMWGFGYTETQGEPTAAQIDSCLSLVGISDCEIQNGKMIKKSAGTQFNFSAITKGFGIDCIARLFDSCGIENYMIEIGGEISLKGVNQQGEKWHIQIDAPSSDKTGHQKLSIIEVSDCCIATSGNYRNYRDTDRGRIGHTISPSTGQPYATNVLSATVIAPTAMTADALATSLMAMDATSGMKMIEDTNGVEAMLVIADGDSYHVLTSSSFPKMK